MKGDNRDVGWIHDLIFGLQNLIASENHAIESFSSSKKEIWLELAEKIRKNRSKWMRIFIKKANDQRYCFSKHILASSMAMKELGNRYQTQGEKELAKECFEESADYEAMFILINQEGGK